MANFHLSPVQVPSAPMMNGNIASQESSSTSPLSSDEHISGRLMEIGCFPVPVHALYYMEYGECDSLYFNDDDKADCDKFLREIAPFGFVADFNADDVYFSHWPAFGLPCEVVDVTFYAA